MNRIVIVGNGFDLAHGLASRYEDFVVDLLKQAITEAYNDFEEKQNLDGHKSYSYNDLIQIGTSTHTFNLNSAIAFATVDEFQKLYILPNGNQQRPINISYTAKLFIRLLNNKNWTDIERIYFNCLIDTGSILTTVENLNKDFEKIKDLFLVYLTKQENQHSIAPNSSIDLLISDKFHSSTLYSSYNPIAQKRADNELKDDTIPILNLERVVYLNFNYTTLLQKVLKGNNWITQNYEIIPIHGQLTETKNIIFGYGDENNDEYKVFEQKDDNAWLKHFKSHYYASTDAYSRLLDVIESEEFDVCVLGHSLGMSDKVLLSTIFEHANCKFIHLTHRGGNSHFEKRIALSRHFTDKALMRSKLMEQNEALKI
jgi:hypothetical protein